jgi:dynein heavy chain
VTIINFGITKQGLKEQMLSFIVQLEQPELQVKSDTIMKENAKNASILKDCEDKILFELENASDDLLADEAIILILEETKEKSNEISIMMEEAAKVSEIIKQEKAYYIEISAVASILFFCIIDFRLIDHMYQFSLNWFKTLFETAVKDAPTGKSKKEKIFNMQEFFTYLLYKNICKGIFDRHKIILSLNLTAQLMFHENKLDDIEFR